MIRTIPKDLKLTLTYNNLKPKAPLGQAVVDSITNNIGQFKTLQFTIPQTVRKNGETVEDPSFDKIQIEQLVLLNDYGYYVIKNIQKTEDSEGIKKVVNCQSIESKLSKKMIVLTHRVIQLQKNTLDTQDGILDIFERETGWKVKHLDEKAQYDLIGGGKSLKYRNMEVNETWWNFMSITLQEAFDVVVYFDHLDKTISVFDRATFGKDSKLILSRKNYLSNVNKTFDNTDIITRLYVEGEEGVSIHSVNPLGTGYIEDFSYFANLDYMSKELIDALEVYYPTLEQLQLMWLDENDILLGFQKETLAIEERLSKKQEELKAKKILQTTYIKDEDGKADSEMLKKIKAEVVQLETDIENINKELEENSTKIKNQTAVLTALSMKMDKTTIEIDGKKIFNEELLEELDNFIMEGSWQSTYHTSDITLYYGGVEQLKKVCKPTFDMTIGVNQLAIDIFQARTITSDLYDLGDFILVENNENSIKKKTKTIYHPLIKGSKKSYQLTVGEDGSLTTSEKLTAIADDIIITDIAGKHHQVMVDNNGKLYTIKTNKKSDCIFRVKASNGRIHKLTVGIDGELHLYDDDFEKVSDFERVRIIGYTYSPQTNATTLTLSTKEFSLTQEGKISTALNSAINNGKVLEKNRMTLDEARENANWIQNYYKNALDVAQKNIISAIGNNSIEISENGIILKDTRNLDDIVMLSVGGIILSKDNLESVRTAITADGIIGEEVIGKLLIGEKLYISDENGELELKGNLLTIRDNLQRAKVRLGEYEKGVYGLQILDDDGNLCISAKGMLQRERMTFADNLDADFPYYFTIPLDAGLSEIRQADLYLEPKKFRGYSKAIKGGGAVIGTTAANSDQTSKPSSMTTSKVNINTGTSGGYGSGSYGSGWGTGWSSGSRMSTTGFEGAHYHLLFVYMGKKVLPSGVTVARYKCNSSNNTMGLIHCSEFGIDYEMTDIYSGAIATPVLAQERQPNELHEIFKEIVGVYPYDVYYVDENMKSRTRVIDEELISRGINAMFEKANESQEHTHNVDHYHNNYHAHNIDHTHTVPAHTHQVSLDDHEHEMIFGIWQDEETALPTVSIDGRVEGGLWETIYENINVKSKLDLKPFLTKVNELNEDTLVEFRITSKTRARIEGSMLMKCMTRY